VPDCLVSLTDLWRSPYFLPSIHVRRELRLVNSHGSKSSELRRSGVDQGPQFMASLMGRSQRGPMCPALAAPVDLAVCGSMGRRLGSGGANRAGGGVWVASRGQAQRRDGHPSWRAMRMTGFDTDRSPIRQTLSPSREFWARRLRPYVPTIHPEGREGEGS
jgi:hypothetical protein